MKYKLKDNRVPQQLLKKICIGCGKESIQSWPASGPLPNVNYGLAKPSKIGCFFGEHMFYPEHQLEVATE